MVWGALRLQVPVSDDSAETSYGILRLTPQGRPGGTSRELRQRPCVELIKSQIIHLVERERSRGLLDDGLDDSLFCPPTRSRDPAKCATSGRCRAYWA